MGECEECKKKHLQTKLSIGASNDPLEQEADRVAERVMRMPVPGTAEILGQSGNSSLQRTCAPCSQEYVAAEKEKRTVRLSSLCPKCAEEEKSRIQRKAKSSMRIQRFAGHATGDEGTAPASVDRVLSSSGGSLDPAMQQDMGQRFGYDFSQVRVHTGTTAEQSARDVNAHAYTVGSNIVFGAGQFAPESHAGRKLIAHELTHVVQQGGVATNQVQRRVIDENVVTNSAMLTGLGLNRQQVIDTIRSADTGAIALAQGAENELISELATATSGGTVNGNSESILNEELGLSYSNASHHGLIRQQAGRFKQIRESLESGYLRYMALGIGTVNLSGCSSSNCGNNFAFSCPGNRLIVLCQTFWDTPTEQDDTVLHEPFHIWFHMAHHSANALRRADASCFESFALRVSGFAATASCVAHTAG